MKILLDECTPHVLKRLLTGFDITTVQELGCDGIKNGALLQLAEGQFDVLITSDQNLKYQQNLANRRLAIVQLPTNQVPLVIQLAPKIQDALNVIETGKIVEIPLSENKK
jgi:predicted nuclease of predicted toxin-antitoxin system